MLRFPSLELFLPIKIKTRCDSVFVINYFTIVREARANEEVSMVYLRTLEREEELKEEGREEGRNIRDQEKIEEMLQRGKQPKEIADFCGYPMELILKVEKGIS